jgi:hypothetical protein
MRSSSAAYYGGKAPGCRVAWNEAEAAARQAQADRLAELLAPPAVPDEVP